MNTVSKQCLTALCLSAAVLISGCSDMKTPATASVAVSKDAVNNASSAGAADYAPLEMRNARDELAQANAAMSDKDYKKAAALANKAQADAKLAQSKADTAKSQATANTLQDDIKVLQDQINRSATP